MEVAMRLGPNLQEKQIGDLRIISKSLIQSNLKTAFFAAVNHFILFRSGAIETPEKAQEFLDCIKGINQEKVLRVLSCQVNTPETDWELIQRQHLRLAFLNQSLGNEGMIAHLNIPINRLFIDPANLPSEFMSKTIIALYRQLNTEGWAIYTQWMNEEMEKVLKTFKPEAVDEYQLQARLEDFGIETHSLLLNDIKKELKNTLLEMDQIELNKNADSDRSLFSLEKKAIFLRERLKNALQIQYIILNDIVEGIGIIEAAHPELLFLKSKALLLASLLGAETGSPKASVLVPEQQLLLIQLLNQQLGVVTCVNCDTGLERTSIAFSLMLGMAEMSATFPLNDLISLILHQKDPSAVEALRRYVLANLESFSLPIALHQGGKKPIPKGMQANHEFLSYLPSGRFYSDLMKQLSDFAY